MRVPDSQASLEIVGEKTLTHREKLALLLDAGVPGDLYHDESGQFTSEAGAVTISKPGGSAGFTRASGGSSAPKSGGTGGGGGGVGSAPSATAVRVKSEHAERAAQSVSVGKQDTSDHSSANEAAQHAVAVGTALEKAGWTSGTSQPVGKTGNETTVVKPASGTEPARAAHVAVTPKAKGSNVHTVTVTPMSAASGQAIGLLKAVANQQNQFKEREAVRTALAEAAKSGAAKEWSAAGANFHRLDTALTEAERVRMEALKSGAADDTMGPDTPQGQLFRTLDAALTKAKAERLAALADGTADDTAPYSEAGQKYQELKRKAQAVGVRVPSTEVKPVAKGGGGGGGKEEQTPKEPKPPELSDADKSTLTWTIGQMKPDEREALEKGYQAAHAAGFAGTIADFLGQQASLYVTAEEGDPRFRTWLSAGTMTSVMTNAGAALAAWAKAMSPAAKKKELTHREKLAFLLENPYHDAEGKFTTAEGDEGGGGGKGGGGGDSAKDDGPKADATPKPTGSETRAVHGVDVVSQGEGRPPVYKVKSVDDAVEHILAGKVVEVEDVRSVNTLLEKLADMAIKAEAAGEKAPDFDLCNVSVKGSNLFCVDKLRDATYPNGVPRWQMPQMGGKPVEGSEADKLPKDKKGEVDAAAQFVAHLKEKGISTKEEPVSAASLKASQAELVGSNVAGMMASKTYDPAKKPIFVSRDNYVVDGHHRWAAVVGRDAKDGTLGESTMNVIRIDAPISEILPLANKWSEKFGIEPKKAGKGGQFSDREPRALLLVDAEEIERQLETLDPDWQWQPDGLRRTFTFPNRRACASFLEALMAEANRANHHPDVNVNECHVLVTFVTHAAGDTVTEKDVAGAARADQIARETPQLLTYREKLWVLANPYHDVRGQFTSAEGDEGGPAADDRSASAEAWRTDTDRIDDREATAVDQKITRATIEHMGDELTESERAVIGNEGKSSTDQVHAAGKLKARVADDVGAALVKTVASADLRHFAGVRVVTSPYQTPLEPKLSRDEWDKADPEVVGTAVASYLVKQWAGSSSDHNAESISIQQAAERVLGVKTSNVPDEWSKVGAAAPSSSDARVFDAFVKSTYENTQTMLKKQGVEYVTLYRGMSLPDNPLDRGTGGRYAGEIEINSRPLSSFSTSYRQAKHFAQESDDDSGDHSVVIAVRVPRERIYSTPLTGPGCADEREVIVLGGPMKALAVDSYMGGRRDERFVSHPKTGADMIKYARAAKKTGTDRRKYLKIPKRQERPEGAW